MISDFDLLSQELHDQAARREALEQRVSDLEAERDTYRELAQQAIHELAELSERHEQQQERYYALLDERRQLRRAA